MVKLTFFIFNLGVRTSVDFETSGIQMYLFIVCSDLAEGKALQKYVGTFRGCLTFMQVVEFRYSICMCIFFTVDFFYLRDP